MADDERAWIRLTDGDGKSLYAIWSRSGKRLIVTAESKTRQVELTPDQVLELAEFLRQSAD